MLCEICRIGRTHTRTHTRLYHFKWKYMRYFRLRNGITITLYNDGFLRRMLAKNVAFFCQFKYVFLCFWSHHDSRYFTSFRRCSIASHSREKKKKMFSLWGGGGVTMDKMCIFFAFLTTGLFVLTQCLLESSCCLC